MGAPAALAVAKEAAAANGLLSAGSGCGCPGRRGSNALEAALLIELARLIDGPLGA